jgi:hypothetical protein
MEFLIRLRKGAPGYANWAFDMARNGGLSYWGLRPTTTRNLYFAKMLWLLLHFPLSDALKKGICSLT